MAFANEQQELQGQAQNGNEAIPGELIISVEPRHTGPNHTIENKGSVKSEEARLNSKGFDVVNALHVEEGDVQALSNEFNAKVIDNMGLVYLVEYDEEAYKTLNKAKQALRHELKELGFKVRYVSENYKMEATEVATSEEATTSMHPNQEWHYNMINAPQAWDITTGSPSVKVAILDTGIDHNHPNLTDIVDTDEGRSFVGGSTMDGNGHGTHVAGTVASYGSVSGVMQNATLVPVKVLSDSGSGTLYGITEGILYAADIGSDVINMSLGGGGYNQSMDEATRTAVESGTIVVAAAGNNGTSSISYPAAYDSVIAVGSVTSDRTRSYFSNYGSGLEVMAPGSDIYSTWPNSQYNTISGTSMASPHAAGVAGLIRAVNPGISVSEARQILSDTAQDAGSSYEYGNGIVDAYAAVQAAGGVTDPDPGDPGEDAITVTSVSTNYSYYYRGETVRITAVVQDGDGAALANANVDFTITRPNGTTVQGAATTDSSGVATWAVGTNYYTATGEYDLRADTSLSGYEDSYDTTSFYVY
nr:S8 family serine peptidase [Caldalkalibacillus salinus]